MDEVKQPSPSTNNSELNPCALSILPELDDGNSLDDHYKFPSSVLSYISAATFTAPLQLVTPGSGLKQLDFSLDNTDFIFDSIWPQTDTLDSGYETSEPTGPQSETDQPKSYIRTYQTDADM